MDGSSNVVIRDEGGAPITIDGVPTCMPIDVNAVSCAAVRRLELDLRDGPDVAAISSPVAMDIEGGMGNDRYTTLATDGLSRVDFDGGVGFDTANYGFATTGVGVSVDLDAGDGRPGDDDRIRDTVERVLGSAFNDVLTGSRRDEHLLGRDGDDRITGRAGEDVLSGEDGNDRIDSRDGEADTVDCGGYALDWATVDGAEASITGCEEIGS